ncbi:ATP-binding protein [uncultured Dubosiella sp.]|uniref:ATP-binding protein n=1 Tax=uncultured Dubosiella sp. TaxID=1937011 RepID=UPI002731364D|nr:AAA family ATPase [uncultured Dubosiella sp.]
MLKRKIWDTLIEWKEDSNKKALCIIGARQIGKSTIVREFGKTNYEQVFEVNFIEDRNAHTIFEGDLSGNKILEGLTAYYHKEIIPGKTLVIFDEVQVCGAARTAVKFLVDDGRIDLIETGSQLGIRYKEFDSLPVGYEQIENMFPLDFEEFVWAMDIQLSTLATLKHCFETKTAPTQTLHEVMMRLFYAYLVVGGMPEVVQSYVVNHDIAKVTKIQRRILDLYRMDIARYAQPTERVKIKEILDAIPSQLDQKTNRFRLSYLHKDARMNRYENSFLWLREAGVAYCCFNIKAPVYPLILNEKRNLFKLYLNDTGLLCSMVEDVQFALLQGDVSINQGSLLENVFAQSFVSKGLSLNYFDNKKWELDFVVEQDREIDLIEIKSGKDYKKHFSLNHALEVKEWKIRDAIVFSKYPLEVENGITYLPFYMIMFYAKKPKAKPLIWNIDLQGF